MNKKRNLHTEKIHRLRHNLSQLFRHSTRKTLIFFPTVFLSNGQVLVHKHRSNKQEGSIWHINFALTIKGDPSEKPKSQFSFPLLVPLQFVEQIKCILQLFIMESIICLCQLKDVVHPFGHNQHQNFGPSNYINQWVFNLLIFDYA